jgi:hypothetical protein
MVERSRITHGVGILLFTDVGIGHNRTHAGASLDRLVGQQSQLLEVLENALRLNEGIRATRDFAEQDWKDRGVPELPAAVSLEGRQARQLENRICSTTLPHQTGGQCGREGADM